MALRCPSCGEAIPFSAEACPSCGADTRVVVLTGDRERPTSRDRGRRWLRASVALAAVAALGGLLWFLGSRADLPPETLVLSEPAAPPAEASGVRGPLQVGQNRWLCPLGWPQAAFDPDHLSFPPNHPRHPPPNVMPAACYQTSAEAEAAGFVQAPPPAGAVVVDGVYLVEWSGSGSGDDLVSDCAASARALDFPVPCPLRLPNASPGGPFPECAKVGPGDGRSCVTDGAFIFEYGGFAVPPAFHVLNPDNPGHIVVTAFITDDDRLDPEVRHSLECPGAVRKGTFDVRLREADGRRGLPSPVAVLTCLAGFPPLDRHTILRWQPLGATYQVAVLGFTDTSLNLAAAVAGSILPVGT